jgi:signal transduction histidine kinase
MLTSETDKPKPDEERKILDQALYRLRLMKRLVTKFLNVSQADANRLHIDFAPTDLNKLVAEEVEQLKQKAREKEVNLRFTPPEHPAPIMNVDDQKTRQAVMNLIDNAIAYTPHGEVTVYLESDPESISFRVVDNGIGVPEDQKPNLFGKFYRADNAKKERPDGTGIGLYLVKRIVEDQGGKIIFESQVGKGSTFGFTLPIKQQPQPSQPSSSHPKSPASPETAQVAPKPQAAEAPSTAPKPSNVLS